jgi:mannitol-1-phosphate 5-dehydrogenase
MHAAARHCGWKRPRSKISFASEFDCFFCEYRVARHAGRRIKIDGFEHFSERLAMSGPTTYSRDDYPSGPRTYVGFGFGAIQAGLFLAEAQASGNFSRLVVAEVDPEIVRSVREAGGRFRVNVVTGEGIEAREIGPIEIEDPATGAGRENLVAALREASEIGTAIPSVAFYRGEGPGSIDALIARGLEARAASAPRAVVYCAENHNDAASILRERVAERLDDGERESAIARVRFLDTVVGKMSGVIEGEAMRARGLAPVTPGVKRAFLVESFNRILVSRVRFEVPFTRGIEVFVEKDDLLPFEEAKLYGHNAVHALGAYLGLLAGCEVFSEVLERPGFRGFLGAAFVEECGTALCRVHAGVDELFTPDGFADYADDILRRMGDAHLGDRLDRVARDPRRKLGCEDRLAGTLRRVRAAGSPGERFAAGVAAGLEALEPGFLDGDRPVRDLLEPVWAEGGSLGRDLEKLLPGVEKARRRLARWKREGCPDPERSLVEGGQSPALCGTNVGSLSKR